MQVVTFRSTRAGLAALAILALAIGAVSVAATPATADDAPWGFEKVTPAGKGGGAIQNTDFFQVAPDGESLLYSTTGPLESVPADGSAAYNMYLARRGATEWSSRSLQPKFTLGSGTSTSGGSIQSVIGTSPNLRWAMVGTPDALAPGAAADSYNLYRLDAYTGALTFMVSVPDRANALQNYNGGQAGPSIKYFADDGKTIMWTGTPNEVPGIANLSLLRWTEDGGAQAGARLPDGSPATVIPFAGNDSVKGDATRESVPRRQNGAPRFAFSTAGFARRAYLQEGDTTRVSSTTRLTATPSVEAPADVRAVSDYGRFTLFATATDNARLTDDTPVGSTHVLYIYDADEDTLTYVGARGSTSDPVLQMSHDGRSVAFQSPRVLAAGAISGRENIYVWRDGTIKFVAAPDPDGAAADPSLFHRLLSENGRYLSFTDDSTSLAASFGFDNTNPNCTVGSAPTPTGRCMQVYRFDADAPPADALTCVSCRTDGQRPAGASGDPASHQGGDQFMNAHQMRMVVDDGTVFFTSADDLIPADANGEHDAYAWHDGHLRLLSRAQTGMRSRFVDANASGTTVLISTNDPIVPTDTDRAVDLYITREGAGYPVPPPAPPEAPCTGTDCRSGANVLAPPPLLGAATNNVLESDNLQPGVPKATARVTRVSLRGSRLRVSVRVSQAGRVRASGAALRTSERTVSRAGTYTLSVPLSKKAQRTLRRRGRLATRTRVSLTPPFGRSAVTTYRRTVRK